MDLFTPLDWAKAANIYEINVRQYSPEGTFLAFAKSLPRLKDMGIEILWFMPITPIATDKRIGTLGSYYACCDYTSINPEFGSLDDFKNVVKQAQDLGFKIIIDWVANHTGYGHTWTKSNPEFYHHDTAGNFVEINGWNDVIDLNYDNLNLRTAMINAMKFWVNECGIDGFRCDMAHLVPIDFWQQARTDLDEIKKLFWLAECEAPNYHPTFDASYRWNFLHTMEKYWRKEVDINVIWDALQTISNSFSHTALHLLFTSNHDENSHSGSEYARLGDAAKPFAVLCSTWNGLPLIYSGQEAASTKQLKFFDKDCIDWSNGFPLHDFYKTLLELRSKNTALRAGDSNVFTQKINTDCNDKLFSFFRKNGDAELLVFINLSSDYYWAHLLDEQIGGTFTNIFSDEENDITKNRYFEMRPWDFYIYSKL